MLCLDVFDHCCVHGTSSFLVGETLTFSRSGERLAWEASYVDVDIWCRSGVAFGAVVECVLWCVVGLDCGADMWVNVTAE